VIFRLSMGQFRPVSWLESHTDLALAIAVIGAVLLGGSRVVSAVRRKRASRQAARARLDTAVGLVRRSLESALVSAVGKESAREWYDLVGAAPHLIPLEANVLEALRLSQRAARTEAINVRLGFDEFQAYAGRVKYIGTAVPVIKDRQAAAREAVSHLRASIEALCRVVPRRPEEPRLPDDQQIPFVAGSPAIGPTTPGTWS
jgi:hypothetical protein